MQAKTKKDRIKELQRHALSNQVSPKSKHSHQP